MMHGDEASASASRRPVMHSIKSQLNRNKEGAGVIKPAVDLWQSLQNERERRQVAEEREKQALGEIEELKRKLDTSCQDSIKELQKAEVPPEHDLQIFELSRQLSESSAQLSAQAESIERQQQLLNSQRSLIHSQEKAMEEKQDLLTSLEVEHNSCKEIQALNEKTWEGRIKELEESVEYIEKVLSQREEELQTRNAWFEDFQNDIRKIFEESFPNGKYVMKKIVVVDEKDCIARLKEWIQAIKSIIKEKDDELMKKSSEIEIFNNDKLNKSLVDRSVQCEPVSGEQELLADVQTKTRQIQLLVKQLKNKDVELEQKDMRFQLIEDKINEFEVKLNYQTGELEEQASIINYLESQLVAMEHENDALKQQVSEREEKLQLVDMLEEELKNRTETLEKRDKQLLELKEASRDEDVKIRLEEAEQQVETLRGYCQYQVKQHEDLLMLQYKLESRLQEQLLRLEEDRVLLERQEQQISGLEGIREELEEKKLLILAKDKHMEDLKRDMKTKLENCEEKLKEFDELLDRKSKQLQSNEEELQRANVLTLNLNKSLEMLKLKQQLEEEEAFRVQEEELQQKAEVLELQSHLLSQLEEFKQTLKQREQLIVERDKELMDIKALLEGQLNEKNQMIQEISIVKQSLKNTKKLEEMLENQDKCIQRLQQQNVELERDLQLQQQEALRQQQDSYEEREVLEEQLHKQSMLLQEQDLRLHQQQEQINGKSKSNRFLGWKRKDSNA